jgi:hypothetical protein
LGADVLFFIEGIMVGDGELVMGSRHDFIQSGDGIKGGDVDELLDILQPLLNVSSLIQGPLLGDSQ